MKQFILIVTLFVTSFVKAQNNDGAILDSMLKKFPEVSVLRKTQTKTGLGYFIGIKQPLDHKNPSKGYFKQLIYLSHRGFEQPTVMETEGYEMNFNQNGNDIENILSANNINIEHRYFGKSKPDSLKWEFLTYEQVANDLHHINQLMRSIYKNKWISTGASRGGQNAIHYKYFFPNDVDITIPVVASLQEDYIDKRFFNFLDTIGTKECRDKILAFQLHLLKNKEQVLDKLKWYAKGQNITFNYMGGLEKAFEYCVLDYQFSFWQFGNDCSKIPTSKNLDECLEYFLEVMGMDWVTDKKVKDLYAHNYMAANQSGYYGYDLTNLEKYLKHYKGTPSALLPPKEVTFKPFDNSYMKSVIKWIDEKGNNMIYIDAALDPYSSCRVIPSNKVNSKSYVMLNTGHMDAQSLKNMTVEMRQDFAETLSKMLGLKVDLSLLK